MRANEYQTRAMSTRLPSCENATYMLFGLMAEVGEIADKIAKWRRKGVWRRRKGILLIGTVDTAYQPAVRSGRVAFIKKVQIEDMKKIMFNDLYG